MVEGQLAREQPTACSLFPDFAKQMQYRRFCETLTDVMKFEAIVQQAKSVENFDGLPWQ